MDSDTNNMRRLGVFKELPRPQDRDIITPPMWFLAINSRTKRSSNIKRNLWNEGVYKYTASMTVKRATSKLSAALISITALFDLELRHFDISAAYLYEGIDEEVYMEPPPCYKNGTVRQGLHGLKQARPAEQGTNVSKPAWRNLGSSSSQGPCRSPHWDLEE